MKDTHLIN